MGFRVSQEYLFGGSRTLEVYIGVPLSRESTTLCLQMQYWDPKPISEKRLMSARGSHEYEA